MARKIKRGSYYRATVSGRDTILRVERINPDHHLTTNMLTGRAVRIKDIARFGDEVTAEDADALLRDDDAGRLLTRAPKGEDGAADLPFSTRGTKTAHSAAGGSKNVTAPTPSASTTNCAKCGSPNAKRWPPLENLYCDDCVRAGDKRLLDAIFSAGAAEGENRPDPPRAPARPVPSVTVTAAGTPAPEPSGVSLAAVLSERQAHRGVEPPHIVGIARAGTGKTTTGIEGLKVVRGLEPSLTPSPQQEEIWKEMAKSEGARTVCFAAYNNAIAAEAQDKLFKAGLDKLRCEAKTLHKLGNYCVWKTFGRLGNPLDGKTRTPQVLATLLDTNVRDLRTRKPTVVQAVSELVSLSKQTMADGSPESLGPLVSRYDIEVGSGAEKEEIYSLVGRVLGACRDPKRFGSIDFDDMVWLPLVLDLPVWRHDLLILDEAQDVSIARQQLALRAGKRIMIVGDPAQAIYGFSGADSESIPRLQAALSGSSAGAVVLPLTVTRRCGKQIVAEARQYVPDFEAHESNPEGRISHANYPVRRTGYGAERKTTVLPIEQTYIPLVREGDFVLCRCNAPLVSECFRFLKLGRKATIQGRNIGDGLISTVEKRRAHSVADLVGKLGDWYSAECAKENALPMPSQSKLEGLRDRYSCLLCFTEGAQTVEDVTGKIRSLFTDRKDEPGVRMSSIHRSKGLEADRVFWLCPEETMPRLDRMQNWEIQQYRNLQYVATTRAIKELIYVT